jgi:RNA polymerase sigma-70 factor (ECF subfamily)
VKARQKWEPQKTSGGGQVEALMTMAGSAAREQSFSDRVAQNQRRVFQIAYSVLGNAADAEEIAQEAFLSAYQNFVQLRDAEKFRAWVNRISFRMALNRQRDARRQMTRDTAWQTLQPEATDGPGSADARLLVEQLRQRMAALPEKLRQVLQLSLVEEMEASDVGAILGIPAGTVRSRLHTARKLLLEAMQ